MKRLRTLKIATVMAAATFGIASSSPWHATISQSDRATTVGNPEAEVRLTSFVSYTCPHCATFTIQGEPALQLAYIGSGKLKMEVRPVIRNPIDLVATMLVQCGDTDKFVRNHTMFMTTQRSWLPIAQRATQVQIARWTLADKSAARRAIANDFGFYGLMESRGYSRPTIDRCLADQAVADRLEANSQADFEQFGVRSTPSFAIDGERLDGVHGWPELETALKTRF